MNRRLRRPSTTPSVILFSLVILGFSTSSILGDDPKILLIAGKPSHGYASHEHYAGMRILEDELRQRGVKVQVIKGWPDDESVFEDVDAISIYCDGGRRHLAIPHLDQIEALASTGVGLSAIHYATETVPGEVGERWLNLLGGHFEINYSVNPHWNAQFESLPDHPVTQGIQPMAIQDEWYFHLRFAPEGITPILSAIAPEHTMSRKDGAHSGNPHVRKSVAAGDSQVVAWTYDRPARNGAEVGRSFGFTGGHHHWNWGRPDVRKLVVQAILWTAGMDEMPNVQEEVMTAVELTSNQDYDQPKKFDIEKVASQFQLAN
ncbi:MAG: ThuA domain-containing protein [Planctomycetota bacterium]